MIVLDLCGGTGAWSEPYRAAGYDVRLVTLPDDVRSYEPPAGVHGVLAAPPCTEFAVSGARWWARKDPSLLKEALSVFDACHKIIKPGCLFTHTRRVGPQSAHPASRIGKSGKR